MRVTELKALARDRGLRNYSRMRKAELVALLQNNPPPGQSRPPAPLPQMSPSGAPPRGATWEPIDDRRPRKRTQQEMDIFEQVHVSNFGGVAGSEDFACAILPTTPLDFQGKV